MDRPSPAAAPERVLTVVAPIPDDVPEGEEVVPASWGSVDLTSYLDGTYSAPQPTLMPRTDGVRLLYPGHVHSFHGESESGKSWVAQAEVARLLTADRPVLYIDFESDPASIAGRLLELGVKGEAITAHLDYRRPERSYRDPAEYQAWLDMLDATYDLAVVDGVTDAIGLFGVKSTDNDEVAQFMRTFPRRLANATGAAVVLIDHVTKDKETRGRFAIGGQAKMASLDGAAYVVDVIEPLGRDLRGVLAIRVAKDRPGTVRGHCGPMRKEDRTQEAARFILDATGDALTTTLEPFEDDRNEAGDFRPTVLMERCSKAIEALPGIGVRAIADVVPGNRGARQEALSRLVEEGFITRDLGPRNAAVYTSLKPFRDDDNDHRSHRSPTVPDCSPGTVGVKESTVPTVPLLPRRGRGTGTVDDSRAAEDQLSVPNGHSGDPFAITLPETCPCLRSVAAHSRGQWATCPQCSVAWHRYGADHLAGCPRCNP